MKSHSFKIPFGQKAIVQDKKEIREQKLGSTKDQSEAKEDTKSSQDAK